ncbi:hypothetical protein CNR22_10285 [Sphingobacteriaceae bacterium]|nr:hypothetical protein CNR22_10285 [Sphingobacteriaceae bacterium]
MRYTAYANNSKTKKMRFGPNNLSSIKLVKAKAMAPDKTKSIIIMPNQMAIVFNPSFIVCVFILLLSAKKSHNVDLAAFFESELNLLNFETKR